MKVDFYASASHYLSHIAPIYQALSPTLRGSFYVSNNTLREELRRRGIPALHSALPRRSGPPVVVASYGDYRTAANRPVIFVEHGAGQTYLTQPTSPGYSGGIGRERTILFICPSETVARRNTDRYPSIPAAVVGCPRLDKLHLGPPRPRTDPPTVVFTFHANYTVAPETTSSYGYFHPAIQHTLDAGYKVLGHGHPRIYRRLVSVYGRYRVPSTPDSDEALSKADVLCVDNSSIGFEAASLGIPLVWLSPPAYRRDVHHGLRFWDALILGEHATEPTDVPAAITRALAPIPAEIRQARDLFISTVYKYSGDAAQRAAEAIMSTVGVMV